MGKGKKKRGGGYAPNAVGQAGLQGNRSQAQPIPPRPRTPLSTAPRAETSFGTPRGGSKIIADINGVEAPYTHARVPRAVWYPSWGDHVSHDVPLADGWCGHIDLTIEAKTELLVGGARRAPTDTRVGEVWPIRLPDGRHAIPDSSLQGMIRSILETVCFGKLGPFVDKRRYGIREINRGETARVAYSSRISEMVDGVIHPKTKAAWVKSDGKGGALWLHCELARIEHSEIEHLAMPSKSAPNLLGALRREGRDAQTKQWKDAPARYRAFLGPTTNLNDLEISVTPPVSGNYHPNRPIFYAKSNANPGGPHNATLVITGKTSSTLRNDDEPIYHTKHMEFLFHTPRRADVLAGHHDWQGIDQETWDDFLLIHEPPKGSGQKINPNWDFWKGEFDAGRPVPLFCLKEGDKPIAFGTAFMFKLAHRQNTHDLLANSSPEHTRRDTAFDLPSLIFGTTGGKGEFFSGNLKRRASFEWAFRETKADDEQISHSNYDNNVILMSPKGYYPAAVRQPSHLGNPLPAGQAHATWTPTDDNELARTSPEHSGIKLRRTARHTAIPGIELNYQYQPVAGNASRLKLHALPVGAKFTSRLHVHNLNSIELGAIVWALTLGGGNVERWHRLGMGKPFGMGAVQIALGDCVLTRNDGSEISGWQHHCQRAFEAAMDAAMPDLASARGTNWNKTGNPVWRETLQVKALLSAATPREGVLTGYMAIRQHQNAKTTGHFLPPIIADDDGWELQRPNSVTPMQTAVAAPRPGNPVPATAAGGISVGSDVRTVAGRVERVTRIEDGWAYFGDRRQPIATLTVIDDD